MSVQYSTSLDTLIEAYKRHQRRTRGLQEQTLRGYERQIRLQVRAALGDDPIDPTRLHPSDVVQFVALMAGQFSARTMKSITTALRSFFRFLRVEGLCDERLEVAIPTVAHWERSTLPQCLSDAQLKHVLAAVDTSKPCGHRDRAILWCLATLGLRPCEVSQLRLEDIDWRQGTVHLRRRKTRRGALVPLPREAGRAIVAYLRAQRPSTDERRVFVQQLGPRRGEPISRHAVSAVAARALRRAHIALPRGGAYVFRHTVASRMVRRGVSLKEVADFLGHRCLDTTTIYAKLDLAALREVALPWPEELR